MTLFVYSLVRQPKEWRCHFLVGQGRKSGLGGGSGCGSRSTITLSRDRRRSRHGKIRSFVLRKHLKVWRLETVPRLRTDRGQARMASRNPPAKVYIIDSRAGAGMRLVISAKLDASYGFLGYQESVC
jgi:hypothetical protein